MFRFEITEEMLVDLKDEQYKQISSKENIKIALQTNKAFGFNIVKEDVVVGFAMLRKYDKRCYFLWDYAIDYRYQNNHYGTKALIELIDFLSKKYDAIELSTTYIYGNDIAKHVYEKVGFVITDIIEEDDIHEVNMILKMMNQ